MNKITVSFDGGRQVIQCPEGTEVGALTGYQINDTGLPYIAALVNNDLSSLSYPLTVNSVVRFVAMNDPHGWRIYRRSLAFLAAKAVRDAFPMSHFKIEYSFGSGLYCSFRGATAKREGISASDVRRIQNLMLAIVKRNLSIERRKISYMDAVLEFEKTGQTDRLNLLKFRNPPRVVIHCCEGFADLAHGPLVPTTGVLSRFKLLPYKPGFVLQIPWREQPKHMAKFQDQPHLFQIFQEHKEWGRILGVSTVGRLNEIVSNGELDSFVMTAEALHEKKLARIAEEVSSKRDGIKVILIAGPSAAGKTTFAKRLSTHLMVNGLRPVTLAADDFFVGEKDNPLDADGKPDYEHIEAVDLELFNNLLGRLIRGREVDLPTFNFATKEREYRGNKLRIADDQIIIIEGIHGLNPRLTHRIPHDRKFRIYVSALTQLNVDSCNRISTTDNRLMRRMVRDYQYRGHSALTTLQLWPSVRRGEKKWIFPYQRYADATFNSALDYELAVLKPLVEPLLLQIKPMNVEFAETRRLSEFLLNFLGTSDRAVPHTSILREYIGGSAYNY